MQKLIKGFIGVFVFALVFSPALVLAANETANLWGEGRIGDKEITANSLAGVSGLTATDPRTIIATLVRSLLGFLGIIAVIIILLGGFKYMTAGGAEDKVEEAKKLMISGVIGLIIVIAAFGIASLVINALNTAIGNQTAT